MKTYSPIAATVASIALLMTGCSGPQFGTPRDNSKTQHSGHADHGERASKVEQQADYPKLSAEDRALAEAQNYCAVTGEPLGSMGPPIKLMVEEQAVFVCCEGCQKQAKSNPDKTLARVNELKAKVRTESAR